MTLRMFGDSATARRMNAIVFEPRKPIETIPGPIPTFSPWSGQYVYIDERDRAASLPVKKSGAA